MMKIFLTHNLWDRRKFSKMDNILQAGEYRKKVKCATL